MNVFDTCCTHATSCPASWWHGPCYQNRLEHSDLKCSKLRYWANFLSKYVHMSQFPICETICDHLRCYGHGALHRLHAATSSQIYWSELFLAINEFWHIWWYINYCHNLKFNGSGQYCSNSGITVMSCCSLAPSHRNIPSPHGMHRYNINWHIFISYLFHLYRLVSLSVQKF